MVKIINFNEDYIIVYGKKIVFNSLIQKDFLFENLVIKHIFALDLYTDYLLSELYEVIPVNQKEYKDMRDMNLQVLFLIYLKLYSLTL